MDKLQPVLAQKYWIVFAAAMILPTTGWWIAAANVQGETETATKAADSAFGSVPPSNSPNGTYREAVQSITDSLVKNNTEYNKYLWETQRATMKWPASIQDDMQKVTYKGDIDIDIRHIYRLEYFIQLNDIPKIVDAPSDERPSGKVMFDLKSFTPQIAESDWGISPPDVKTMWDVQEDLWLLSALLGAVADTNRGYDNILQAPIKEIVKIELRGGSPRSAAGGTSAETGGDSDTSEGAQEMATSESQFGSSRDGGDDMGMQRGGGAGADFDLADVFGSDALQSSDEKQESSSDDGDDGAAKGSYSAFGSGQRGSNRRRYIDDEEGAPFKTRGFYLQVVMDHSKLPDLMVQLASLDWPVEIVRVQQAILNPDQFAGAASGRNQNGGMPGMPGGQGMQQFGRRGMGSGAGGGSRRSFNSLGGRSGRSPMGSTGSMGPMGPMGPGGAMGPMGAGIRGGVEQDEAAVFSLMYSAAMQKTSLVEVAIAGKLTLFQPPAEDESAIAANDESAPPADDAATTEPPTGDVETADGAETKPEAETTKEPTLPATSGNTPAGTPPANSTPEDSTPPIPNPDEKAAPIPEATPASGNSKTDAAQPKQ